MSTPLPVLNALPPRINTAADYKPLARARLDDDVWSYLDGAAGQAKTSDENIRAFDTIQLMPRPLIKPAKH